MFHELPWLPAPNQTDRDSLKLLDLSDPERALVRLRSLAEHRWNASELSSIGRKLRAILISAGPNWKDMAKNNGLAPVSLLSISSGTASYLAEPIAAAALMRGVVLECDIVEYQEPESWIAQNSDRLAIFRPDFVLLSLDRAALPLQSQVGDQADADAAVSSAMDRVNAICVRLRQQGAGSVIVANLARQAIDPQSSIESWLPGSASYLTAHFNRRLADASSKGSFTLFDVAGIADLVGQSAWQPGRYRYMAAMPFSPDCAPLYATRLANLIASLLGKSRRVLVLDLDNTLWSGVIGDDGVEGIVLGGDSLLGKLHIDIQRMALQYAERGIVLCVASKNSREIALEAFRMHPEMILREENIAIFEIHWNSKTESIRAMSNALNLGLESFVFLDDNPAERKQVRDALPGVAVPELPSDPAQWLSVFQAAAYFDQPSFSPEDLKRNEFYRSNAQRAALKDSVGEDVDFLKSLEMRMQVRPFDALGRKRIAQLVAKSNQFNLTTRRYSEAQLADMEAGPEWETLQIRLADVFGDNGMISVVICKKSPDMWVIDTWLMSCRVLGRKVEEAVLNILARRALFTGARELRGRYIPTSKNGIVKDHYKKLGFQLAKENNGETEWSLSLLGFNPSAVPMAIVEDQTAAPVADTEVSA